VGGSGKPVVVQNVGRRLRESPRTPIAFSRQSTDSLASLTRSCAGGKAAFKMAAPHVRTRFLPCTCYTETGANGKNGDDGKNGINGKDGAAGKNGANCKDAQRNDLTGAESSETSFQRGLQRSRKRRTVSVVQHFDKLAIWDVQESLSESSSAMCYPITACVSDNTKK